MKFIKTSIPDVVLIEPIVFGDDRGFFMETWREDIFNEKIGTTSFVQDNHSKSKQGTLRGLHYQTENTQGKLVRVTKGSVFDVAVDLRKSSPTFGKWVGYELSESNKLMLWVPAGFAHGFYVTSEFAEFTYKCTNKYSPVHEQSLKWDDPDLAIDWPLLNSQPNLSHKDLLGTSFKNAITFE
jgi:dTDP-4-dehydrorhamnose 3,5-epimerase